MLGKREPHIYGSTTLAEVAEICIAAGARQGLEVEFLQSNYEGEIVEWIQTAIDTCDAIVINAGAFTHTSIAIHDALGLVACPVIEVHLSNIFARERFRARSYVAPVATGSISGLGATGYELAIEAIAALSAAGDGS